MNNLVNLEQVQQYTITPEEQKAVLKLASASISELQDLIIRNNVQAGWYTDLETGELRHRQPLDHIALIHSEVSEACDGVRKDLMDDKLPHRKMEEVELADAIIRILDMAGERNLDVAGALVEKFIYNKTRLDHKLANRKADGGKRL